MTREEAISILWQYDVNFEPHPAEDVMHAIDMAIEALKAQDVPDINVGDMVYRQAAIDALIKADYEFTGILSEPRARMFEQTINALPSAQPLIRTEMSSADDIISRQAAIDALVCIGSLDTEADRKYARSVLEALPSAQPDRDIPKKPTKTTDRTWGIPHRQPVCPNCGCYLGMTWFICDGDGKRKVTFCETCGQAIDWEGWDEDG